MNGLESTGLNKTGITSNAVKNLGFSGLGDSVGKNPTTGNGTLGPGGPAKKLGNPMVMGNAVIDSADTQMLDVPEGGTLESGGING